MKTLELNRELLVESGIPEPYWLLGRDTYMSNTAALSAVEHYVTVNAERARSKGIGLFLFGAELCGKTFLLTYALKCLMARGYDVHYVSLEALIENYFDKNKAASFRQQMRAPDFLAIDTVDLSGKGAIELVLDQILRMCKDYAAPVLMASSLSPAEMGAHFKESTVAYIRAHTVPIKVKMDAAIRDRYYRSLKKGFQHVD